MQLPPYPPLIYRNGAKKEEYSEALHLIYNERIVPKDLNLLGKTVSLTWDSSTHGKNDLFWHLITGKYDANVEDLRFDRGERLLYIPYMIEHCDTSIKDIHWYYQTEKSRSKLIILNFDLNNRYLCAFRENVDCFQLLTGFPPSLRSFKKKIMAYKKYWENKNRPLKREDGFRNFFYVLVDKLSTQLISNMMLVCQVSRMVFLEDYTCLHCSTENR